MSVWMQLKWKPVFTKFNFSNSLCGQKMGWWPFATVAQLWKIQKIKSTPGQQGLQTFVHQRLLLGICSKYIIFKPPVILTLRFFWICEGRFPDSALYNSYDETGSTTDQQLSVVEKRWVRSQHGTLVGFAANRTMIVPILNYVYEKTLLSF